jgi:GNAT superfamily N-acetyltransferase
VESLKAARTIVRRIELGDVPAVVAACEWLFVPPGSRPPSWNAEAAARRLRDLCTAPDASAFVACLGETINGFCTVYLDLESVRAGQRAWMNELAVDPAHRCRGVGRSLLITAREWAREHGATHFMVDSSVLRVDAHRFYRRQQPTFEAICFGWIL